MDIDAPLPQNKSIQFSSDNTAGKSKRIVADLPVEAGDNLPWCVDTERLHFSQLMYFRRVEKYRPKTLSDVSGHQDILATINRFVEHNVRPRVFSILCSTALFIDLHSSAPSSSPSLWASGHGQDLHHSRSRATNLRQEHAPDGPRTKRLGRSWHRCCS